MKQLTRLISCILIIWALIPCSAGAADATPAFDARYKSLIAELRCLVCQNQSLADSSADLAVDMRREVHKLMEQGSSDKEIVAFLVARYGDFVRYRPPVKRSTLLLWFGPLLLLLIGTIIVVFSVRGHKATTTETLSESGHQQAQSLLKNTHENKDT